MAWRQLLAYLTVFATGGASLATSGCDGPLHADAATHLTLGAQGDTTCAHFRITTDRDLDSIGVTVRLMGGSDSVEVTVPSPLIAPRGLESPVPADTDGVSFSVTADSPQRQTICQGFCAKDFDVALTLASGSDPADVELEVGAVTTDDDCDMPTHYYLVIERVDE